MMRVDGEEGEYLLLSGKGSVKPPMVIDRLEGTIVRCYDI